MAFYTRGWRHVSGGIDVDGGGADGLFGSGGSALSGNWGPGGQNGLNKIYELKSTGGWKEIWDNSAKAHFLYSSSQAALYTYDTVKSVEEKTNYCKARNCGGMFNWEIDGDTNVGGQSYPLITRVADLLAEGGCTPNRNCPTNSCGTIADGCGGTLNCGSCSGGAVCSNNQCVTACQTAQCGTSCGTIDDGCGGTRDCGGCPSGQTR